LGNPFACFDPNSPDGHEQIDVGESVKTGATLALLPPLRPCKEQSTAVKQALHPLAI
jgi:hypothetical protein